MDRSRFREFLHNAFDMTDDILLDRIFKYFDSDNDGYIGREEWIMGLSVFLKGNLTEYQPENNRPKLLEPALNRNNIQVITIVRHRRRTHPVLF